MNNELNKLQKQLAILNRALSRAELEVLKLHTDILIVEIEIDEINAQTADFQ